MSDENLYGPVVTRRQIGEWLRDHLLGTGPDYDDGWFLPYLREVQRIAGWASIDADPVNWPPDFRAHRFTTSENTVINLPENDLPALLIGSPGLGREPQTHSEEKALEGEWIFGLHALVSDEDEEWTDRFAGEYAAALMAACSQQRVLGDDLAYIAGVSDMAFDALPQIASRTLAAGTVTVRVVVEEMVHTAAGPITRPDDPDVDPGALPEFDPDASSIDVDHEDE